MPDDQPIFPPVFATNRPATTGESVAAEVNRLLEGVRSQYASPAELAIATAYINPGGFGLIADEVEQAPKVRLLLGAEPETPPVRRVQRPSPFDEHIAGLIDERDLTGFTTVEDRHARRLVAWLRSTTEGDSPTVEVRRLTQEFLHGKAFIACHPMLPATLAGSANLTFAGLMRNRELNLGYPNGQHTQLVIDWFEELWEEASPFDLAAIYEARWQAHQPWTVFLRMLWELYGTEKDEDADVRLGMRLTGFQRDGVVRALRILNGLGGVLVCDEVGLGKTFVAGEIIWQAAHVQRQDVLVVVPAALKESTWDPFLRRHDFSRRVTVVTYDELRLGTRPEVSDAALGQYALVVVDEAHNLRNTQALRAQAVDRLLGGEIRKKVVLLTATPVNNSLTDLQALISFFVKNDAQFASVGIPSIDRYIKTALAMDPEAISPEHLFDLMDQVAVRRTRRFIKDNYAGETMTGPNGQQVVIEFPTPTVYRIDYELSPEGQELLDAVVEALEPDDNQPGPAALLKLSDRAPGKLVMARYTSARWRLEDDEEEGRQLANSGLLKSALLKRLESSNRALAVTLGRLVLSHERFLAGLNAGHVITGESLEDLIATDDDGLEYFFATIDADTAGAVPIAKFDSAELLGHVEADLEVLRGLKALADAASAASDPKADKLIELIADSAEKAQRPDRDGVSERDRRKVLVFSTYTDTIKDIRERVAQAVEAAENGSPLGTYKDRIANAVFGSKTGIDQQSRANTIAQFAPATAGLLNADGVPLTEDKFDLLFTTDVLAEGVNLQQAGHIVNYDMPWNPQKMVQRHGRVDRIGSHHKTIRFGCFFPARNLDRLLRLEETLQRKLAYANAAVGVSHVLPGQITDPNVQVSLHDIATQHEQILDLYNENNDLLLSGGSAALSGEEYRVRLNQALEGNPELASDVNALAYGSGSGFLGEYPTPGWVFCARIASHDQPWFRFVPADENWAPATDPTTGENLVIGDTLTALIAADPGGPDRPAAVPEGAASGVFDAWAVAQADIHRVWTFLTDRANLTAPVPAAVREAHQLVAEHGGSLGMEEQQHLAARLNATWPRRIVNAIREIIRRDAPANARISELAEYVANEGLEPPTPVRPLPPVEESEIRLVCWMAVHPAAGPQTVAEQIGELPLGDKL